MPTRADRAPDAGRYTAAVPAPPRRPALVERLTGVARQVSAAYRGGRPRPLSGYVGELAAYSAVVAALAVAVRAGRPGVPRRLGAADIALLAAATHKLSRLLAKSSITSPLRAPFVRFVEPAGPAEVMEEPRLRHPVGRAVGELITCPFCLGVWVCTGLTAGLLLAPRPTRVLAGALTAVAGADFLHLAYGALERAAESESD
ncbi:hypothetical protein GCM10010123_39830 [Pilimelia anulata]|uniref:DUF1360 domain-containing protein n=1 Tax=Pilimelia anulata TaxID=53371 RepID=A0A8J3BID8_9ACTN|nr:DUF1360 domain-containing protein [Pilimelia anulata]GGK05897.1 hypothetical protein GCM10010123_39830 [Pilimelia anulata]